MSDGTSASNLQSVKDAQKRLQKFLRELDTVPTEELTKSAQKIYSEAVAQTPYETGKLEDSVYVRVSKAKSRIGLNAGASAKSETGYNYAGIQHEETNFRHPIKGKAHYISDPFNKEITNFIRRVRRRLKMKDGS